MTPNELRAAELAYEAASGNAEEARATRNAAILQALDEGWTQKLIAEVTGLTDGRIAQIAVANRKS